MVRASARRVPPANCRRALARRRVMPALLVTTAWLGLRARLGAALARSRLLRARARALAALPASTRARAVRRAASTALLVRIACLARQLQPRAWLEAIGRRSARSRRLTASAARKAPRVSQALQPRWTAHLAASVLVVLPRAGCANLESTNLRMRCIIAKSVRLDLTASLARARRCSANLAPTRACLA